MEEKQLNLDDSKELVVIDYYDRIHKQWIKVEVTKEVARFMKADEKATRRKQNQYNFYNIPLSKFESEDNDNFFDVVDENSNIGTILEAQAQERINSAEIEHKKVLIENSLDILSPAQREVVEMTFYQNMSQNEIANTLGISKTSVQERLKNAKKNIKKHLFDTEN